MIFLIPGSDRVGDRAYSLRRVDEQLAAKLRLIAGGLGKTPAVTSNQYFVEVADNSHHGARAYKQGSYPTYAAAVTVAREIVDGNLHGEYRPGCSADYLYGQYTIFGDDPYVYGPDYESLFSAWDYARHRCDEICRPKPSKFENRQ